MLSLLRQSGPRIHRTRPPPISPTSPFSKLRSWIVSGAKCLSPESESARSVEMCAISPIPALSLTNGIASKCQMVSLLPIRPYPCIQLTLVFATFLITYPVGFVPPLHDSSFPHTPPSTPNPEIQGCRSRTNLDPNLDSIGWLIATFPPLRIGNTSHNLHAICVMGTVGRVRRFNVFSNFGDDISVALITGWELCFRPANSGSR
ncbi:hypothetical protein H4582DRAFT_761158 [Lactarius indigo]|nr:hypothetical protein H4582DRAFT_761158 [Lactarius indigo]